MVASCDSYFNKDEKTPTFTLTQNDRLIHDVAHEIRAIEKPLTNPFKLSIKITVFVICGRVLWLGTKVKDKKMEIWKKKSTLSNCVSSSCLVQTSAIVAHATFCNLLVDIFATYD